MKKRLFFIIFMTLFCSTMFGQQPWTPTGDDGTYSSNFTIDAVIQFDGVEAESGDLELGVFYGDECRASAKAVNFGTGHYVAEVIVFGEAGQFYTLKLYDHSTGQIFSDNYVVKYDGGVIDDLIIPFIDDYSYGTLFNPATINFKTPNYYTPDTYGDNENISITAVVLIDGVEQYDSNLELGAFCGNVVKGSAKTNFVDTNNGVTRNYARTTVSGKSNDVITFRLYNHSTGKELEFTEVNTINFVANTSVGTILQPLEVNFITAPYVAQIGNNKYLSFDAALEAAEDGDNIELLKSIDLGTTTAVIEESINITLGSFSITGTVELANISATITGAENGVTEVITNVADYKVVYEDGKYKLVKKLSGEIAYRAYVTDTESVEAVSVDLSNVYASSSLKVELYNVKDAVEELLVTTTYAKTNFPIDADAFTCFMVLSGTPDDYWSTTINAEELTIENLPTVIKLYVDGELVDTFDNALGAGTNVDETAEYKALDCVYDYEVAKVGDKVYWNINNAIANWTAGSTLTLLEDVTLSDVITLKSTEHHILNLDKYTMTAAEGKNAIEITCNAQSSETYALTVKANSETPGGIIAGNKSCIYYSKSDETKDRPIITIENGVFNGGYSINIYSSNRGTNCPTVKIANGTFNGNVNIAHGKLITTGGIFNGWINCTGDVTAYRLISGGTFKQWLFMTTGPSNGEQKFTVGKTKNVFDCGVYVDDNGFLVVGGDVITEAGTRFKASSDNYSGWSTYLQYSSAATNGLYYTSAIEALADNNKTNGSVNIYTDELDLRSLNYKGTLVIEDDLIVTFNEGTTPAWKVASGEEGHEVGYTESVENGVVTRVYTLFTPVAQVGETSYATLQEAIDATTSENTTVKVLQDITLEQTATIAEGKTVVLDLNGKTINVGYQENSEDKHIYAFENKGTLTITDNSAEANGVINARGNYNDGTLTLEKGTINAIDHNGGYGVQNRVGSKFTMNGGTIAATNDGNDAPGVTGAYDATTVRVESGATFTMNGGTINNSCNYTFAIDNYGTTTIEGGTITSVHSTVANYGTMTIEGGSFTCNGLEGITAHAIWAAAGTTTINGGTFDGKDNYNGFNVDASAGATVYITGGNFLPVHSGSLYGEGTIAVSGGTFFDAVPEARCAEGYIPTTNTDGTYGVKPGSYVAQVGEVKYETLQAALAAAQANETITMLADVTLSETMTIEKAITINLNENTVTGADGAIVFNVKASTTIKNGTVLGNKSGTSSGLIDIYADINLDGVTIETTKIRALAFKESVSGTPSTATLTNCNVTGGFKGYGGSVWEIKSGVYKASSTSITDQLNGTASVSGGTFHYEIDETDCAPGYVVKNNGDGTWTVEYAPAAFVDTDKDGVYDEDVDVLYGNLDQIFADYRTGDVHVVLTKEVVVANNKVDTDVDAHFYITTNVEGGTTMDFLYADPEDVQPYNCVQNMDIAENVTLNVKYFTIYGNFNLKGTVNAFYPFIIAANVNIAEDALFNQNVEGVNSEAIQIKDGAVVTVEGKVEAKYINLYKSDSYTGEQGACLRVTGANAEVNVSSVDLWKGETLLIVENGAKFKANSIKASRGGSIEVDGATIDAAIRLGHDTTDETTLTASGTCTLGQITLATLGSKVVGPEGFEVVSGLDDYGVNYYNGVYSLVQIVTQSQTLSAGWNWFSSYIDINGTTGLAKLQNALGTNGIQIKGNNSFTNYTGNEEQPWFGNLTSTSVKEMYMIKVTDNHSLQMEGNIIVPSENAIELTSGWNWIGYQLNQVIGLNDVLKNANFTPNNGDRIKSHLGFSQYYENIGWWGTLNNMTPGVGYMYYNAGTTSTTLTYSYPAEGSRSEVRANITSENNYWIPASSQFANNMNIIAVLDVEDEDYEIAAFVGGEVRGSARPIYVEPLDAYMFFLTIHGEGVEEMTFKCYDLATGEELSFNDRINYSDNAVLGSIEEPYKFNATLGIGENAASAISIYPNPTTTGNEINLAATCDTVEVFNALGVKIAEYQNVDTIDAIETAGVYMIRVTNNGNVQNCRLVVK